MGYMLDVMLDSTSERDVNSDWNQIQTFDKSFFIQLHWTVLNIKHML